MLDGPTGTQPVRYDPPPPPPPPPPPVDTGQHLSDEQLRSTASQVLDVGSRTLWTDDYDARLDHFAEVSAGLDADSRARLFAEVLRQDSGAFHSWLQGDRLNDLGDRVTSAERAAVVDAFAAAYNAGSVEYTQAQAFLGAVTQMAPALAKDQFQGARALLDAAGDSPAVQQFRESYAHDAFSAAAQRAANGYGHGMGGMDAAFAVTLLGDGSNPSAVSDVFTRFNADSQRAIAADIAYASVGYRNSRSEIPGLADPLETLTRSVQAGNPADTSLGRLIQTRIADGITSVREPETQPAATALYRSVAEGAAQERAADPQALTRGLTRVNEATSAAERVFAQLPPNASKEQIYAAISQNYDAVVAPTFTQYLQLRGDAARELSGSALRNEIGLAMGLQPNNVPATPEQQAALERGEWDYFTGDEASAVRTVESRIAEVGGPGARVAALPVMVSSEEIGGVIQVPLYRVETADGQTRFVDFNPATGEARSYRDFQDWRENNKLPPGRMSFAENGHLTADESGNPRIVTENTPGTVDTFWEEWGQPVLDGAAMVGGVVLVGAAIVGTGGTALVVGGALLGAYGAYRGGEVLVDRAQHGQTVNPLESPEARNAWLNVGASAVGFAAAGATLRAASLAGHTAGGLDDAARLLSAANTARAANVAAQYADTAAMVDTGYSLAANWDRLTPQQRMTALAQMAFWGGGTAVAARQSGGLSNLYGVGDMAQAMSQTNQWIRSQLPSGAEVQQVFSNATDAARALDPRNYQIVEMRTPEGLTLHAIVRRPDAPGSSGTEPGGLTTGLRTEFPEAQRVTLDAQGRFNGLDNAGPNAPIFQRWVDRGGEVFYDQASNTFVYAIEMETRGQPGVTQRVEVPYRLDANGNRRADFSAYSRFDTSIDPNLPADRANHFREANRDLTAALAADPGLQQRLGLSDEVVAMVTKEPPDGRSPSPYTWHHVDGSGRMMLVDFAIHQRFTHFGGFSEWGGR